MCSNQPINYGILKCHCCAKMLISAKVLIYSRDQKNGIPKRRAEKADLKLSWCIAINIPFVKAF